MRIEFSGAARSVTGSKHLIRVNNKNILLDCGLFQGKRKQSFEANTHFPFKASEIDVLVLSHAHIDHSGSIPILAKNGFTGPIYCTHATRDLCSVMLKDSAHIQEHDAEWIKKEKKDIHAEPLYTVEDAERCLSLFRSVDYDHPFMVAPNVKMTFHDAGHILGSALEEWEIFDEATQQKIRFGFTGDLGRKNLPILKDPSFLSHMDAFITESTYGNRFHDEIKDVEEKFATSVNAAIGRGGKVIIPAFSVERTQEILYVINDLISKGKMKKFPIFIDSPLSTAATEIFALHSECFDNELRSLLAKGEDPFCEHSDHVHFIRDTEESKALNNFPGPAMIISASGMCEAGRIRHHLVNHISDEKTLILIVGFMAENTLGRKLVDHENPVNIFGEPHQVKAEVVIFNAFSGHADQKGLLDFAGNIGTPKGVFLVHGEDDSLLALQSKLSQLENLKQATVFIPNPGDIFEMDKNKNWKKLEETNPISKKLFGSELKPL